MVMSEFTFGEEDAMELEDFISRAPGLKRIGHLLPGHIVNPSGVNRGPKVGLSPMYSPGHPHLGGYGYSGPGMSSLAYACDWGRARFGPMAINCGSCSGGGGGACNVQGGADGNYSATMIGGGMKGDIWDYNPYDLRINCNSRCWCPGAGIGLPACSTTDTFTGGDFRRVNCPTGWCTDYY